MNVGLLLKTAREMGVMLAIMATAMALFETLLIQALSAFHQHISETLMKVQFVRDMIGGLIGTDLGPEGGMQALIAVPWAHPVVLAVLWSYAIVFCTRIPAGEVDRGTVDVLLGLPVSRWTVFIHDTGCWVVSGIILVLMAGLGGVIGGGALDPDMRPALGVLVLVCANLYAVYLAVGSLAYLVSALSDRRGRAIGLVFAIVVLSFLLSFLAQTWDPAKPLAFLSVLHYYKPAVILQQQTWPLAHLAILGGCSLTLWISAAVIFCRRDICTV